MNVTYERAAWEFRDTEPRRRVPNINIPGFASADAKVRLQAVHDLEKSIANFFRTNRDPDMQLMTGVILAARLFADPDREVAKAARESAASQIKPRLEKQKRDRDAMRRLRRP